MEQALTGHFRRALRIHPRRGGLSEHWQDIEQIPWSSWGVFHADHENPGQFLDYHTGAVYPQDAASQLPVELLDVHEGEIILDACAAPGSKTSALALKLQNTGCVLASDKSGSRRRVIRETAARQGLFNVAVTPLALHELNPDDLQVDAALVDVPCSGHEKRSQKQVQKMQATQLAILNQVAQLVRPGGRLVYSTCTMYTAENESVVEGFLAEHGDWSARAFSVPDLGAAGPFGLRIDPLQHGTEPFFCAILDRSGDGAAHAPVRQVDQATENIPFIKDLPAEIQIMRHQDYVLGMNSVVAGLDLPLESRGMMLAEWQHEQWRMNQWAAQACIEYGVDARTVTYDEALRLWSGESLGSIEQAQLLQLENGAPLGLTRAKECRLNLSSRAFRSVR